MARTMILGLGPVLRYELITTARRGRYYLVRVVYGLSLLVLLSGQFGTWELNHPGGGRIEEVHRFAEETFILFAEAGLSYKEIADVQEIPIGTVMSRLHHARNKLQAYLQLDGIEGIQA